MLRKFRRVMVIGTLALNGTVLFKLSNEFEENGIDTGLFKYLPS